jgi:hypothetical protein
MSLTEGVVWGFLQPPVSRTAMTMAIRGASFFMFSYRTPFGSRSCVQFAPRTTFIVVSIVTAIPR